MKIIWADEALKDLRAIHDFIARDSKLYAGRMVQRLIARIEDVAEMPTIGHTVHEFPKLGLRETHQDNYRLIYGFNAKELKVLTIIHMKQILRRRRLRP